MADRPSFDPTITAPGAPRPAPVRFAQGDLVANRYRIMRFIAQGGMGEVYEAEDITLGERIALKTVSAERVGDPRADEYFRRELLLARRVTHPNVCRLFDVGVHGETRFLTMELLLGQTLAHRIRNGGRFAPDEALPIVRQMAAALAAAHQVGVVHRDFKSHNVIIDAKRAVVTDFGLARAMAGEAKGQSLSDSGQLVGTPHYMAPEQVEGGTVGPPADIYALGVVLFEMMTGALPFEGNSAMAIAVKRLTTPPPQPRTLAPKLPERWQQVILGCLERNPADRPPSATAVFEQLAGEIPVTGPVRRVRMHRMRWIALAMLIVLAGAGALVLGRHRPAAAHGRRAVAILGFENRAGRADAAWLSTALAEMLSTELSAGGELRTIPAESVARVERELGIKAADGLGKEALDRVRDALGADYVIVGSYVEVGAAGQARVRLDLRLQDAQSGDISFSAAETAPESELFDLVSRAGASLRSRLGAAAVPESETAGVRAALPGTSDAARLYAEGVAAIRAYDYQIARDKLRAAIASEPDFALSHAALADALTGLGHDREAAEEASRALELGTHLPRADRLMIEAKVHESKHEWKQAVDVWRSLYAFFPDQIEYGLSLARAQRNGGDAKGSLETLAALRKLPRPVSDDPRIDWVSAKAYNMLSDMKQDEEVSRRAADKARALGEHVLAGEALNELGWSLRQQGRPAAEQEKIFREAESHFLAVGVARGAAQAKHNLAYVKFDANDHAGAIRDALSALVTLRELGADQYAGGVANTLGIFMSEDGDLDGGRKYFDEARQLAQKLGDNLGESLATLNVGITCERMGDLPQAHKWIDDALALFRKIGHVRGEASALEEMANMKRLEGDLPGARKLIDEGVALFQKIHWAEPGESSYAERCAMAVAAFDRQNAKSVCEGYPKSVSSHVAGTAVQLAELLRLEDRTDDALAQARKVAEKADYPLDVAGARELEARILLARGDAAGASKAIEAAQAAEKKYPSAAFGLELGVTSARVQAARGDTAGARRELQKVLDEAHKRGMLSVQLAARIAQAEIAHDARALAAATREASQHGFAALAASARQK
jgi:tetratricopeptide (TPR) repeat protein